jgi:CRISPR-associated endoribonuclease Cas6
VDLDFVRIECDVKTDIPGQLLALLYDSLRTYEVQFRAACCPSLEKSCSTCNSHVDCPYRIIFDQKLSSDPEIVRLHQKPPLPFSLYIKYINSYTSCNTIGLVVIGSAVNYVDIFHKALLRMIAAAVSDVLPHAQTTLHSSSLDYHGVRHEISGDASLPESVIMLSGLHILNNTVSTDSLRLSVQSPLRLLSNGSILHRFDFAAFFRSQLRRCSSLYAYYGTGRLDFDFVRLSESAQNVTVFDNKIHYTQPAWTSRLNRAGLLGTAECAGLVEPISSFLLLGSYFNAGKGATLGAGYYQIEVM